MKWRVAVEKLPPRKVLRKTLRQQALQATFAPRVDIFYPQNFGCFAKNGLFQQPRDFSPTKGLLISPAR